MTKTPGIMLEGREDEFYVTGQGVVIHWACEFAVKLPSGVPRHETLNAAAMAHLRQGCVGDPEFWHGP